MIKDSVTIKCGKWEAGACARLGGNLIYLKYDGKDILKPLLDEAELDENPYIQGAPILLPANRTYLGKFSFEGRDYELPINEARTNSHLHGLVHRQCFDVLSVSENAITMKYANRGECYPFDFDLTVTYAVDEEGLTQTYVIENVGALNMPYVFCLHSTFVEPDNFVLPITRRQEDVRSIPTGRYVELTEQEKKYLTGSVSKDIYVVGYYEMAARTSEIDDILYTVSDNFDHWIMYNAMGKRGFLCLEPQAGKVNGLNIEGGCPVIAPGKSHTYTTRYTHK